MDKAKSRDTRKRERPPDAVPIPVIGLGASAGGLKAFTELLTALPADTGGAFVLIQHLAPDHPSALREHLQKATQMPVVEVQRGLRLAPNHVYVIAPGTRVKLEGALLRPTRRPPRGRTPFLPINDFFSSLALDRKSRSIGVVLSGTASDGTEGLRAIKAEGGVTYAQDPTSAAFEGMPRSAIGGGVVDFILSPERIAVELAALLRHPYVARADDRLEPSEQHQRDLDRIIAHLRADTGIDFSEYKASTFRRRLARRMALQRISTLADYAEHLERTPGEAHLLYEDVLIHVTSFFRDPDVFEELCQRAIPELLRKRPQSEPLRVWVAGCALGEEAYSVAMCLADSIAKVRHSAGFQLFASDVSQRAVDRARAGFYPDGAVRSLTPAQLRKHFHKVEGGYRVNQQLRERCIFLKHDLARDPPLSRMDLVTCRNVLIYFTPELQKRVLATFHYCLNEWGTLLLGRSETAASQPALFAPVGKKWQLYRKLPARSPIHFGAAPALPRARVPLMLTPPAAASSVVDSPELDRLLLAYGPAAVVVNDRFEILEYRGHTSPFLEQPPGQPQLNLLKLARQGLAAELRLALSRAKQTGTVVQRENLETKSGGLSTSFDLLVAPLQGRRAGAAYAVVFLRLPPRARGSRSRKVKPGATPSAELERELTASRELLRSVVEEHQQTHDALTAANEELVSGNEELQSMNEELETAKEELQSTNEELTTVNDELQTRNNELGVANADLLNVLNSIDIPLLILDGQRRIRRMNPSARGLMNVLPSDLGRAISDLKLNVDVPELDELIGEAMDTVSLRQKDVADKDGKWNRFTVRPYKNADNKIDGVVLSLIDIDLLKRTAKDAEWARDFSNAIVEAVPLPLIVLDHNKLVVTTNDAFRAHFRAENAELIGRELFTLDEGAWSTPRLRALVAAVLDKGVASAPIEVRRQLSAGSTRTFLIRARPLVSREGHRLCLLAFEDITARLLRERETITQLERAQRDRNAAQSATLAKDELLAAVSHDLRTPLAALLMQVRLLNAGTLSAEGARRATELVERTVELQTRLVDDLLDLSRIATGKLRLQLGAVDLSEVVNAGIAVVAPLAEQRSVVLERMIDEHVLVKGDSARLQQVIWNLLSNAIKFSDENGIVRIAVTHDDENATITVADSGAGIAAEELPGIFERFAQGAPRAKSGPASSGLGLGLSISRHVVQAHGGAIRADSRGVNLGATFTVTLPLVRSRSA